jgi:hypothetical protein
MGLAEPHIANRRENFGLNTQNSPNSKFSAFSLNLFFSFFKLEILSHYKLKLKEYLPNLQTVIKILSKNKLKKAKICTFLNVCFLLFPNHYRINSFEIELFNINFEENFYGC